MPGPMFLPGGSLSRVEGLCPGWVSGGSLEGLCPEWPLSRRVSVLSRRVSVQDGGLCPGWGSLSRVVLCPGWVSVQRGSVQEGLCQGQYASYWNAFLFKSFFFKSSCQSFCLHE